jgi:hypothetical protein
MHLDVINVLMVLNAMGLDETTRPGERVRDV